jgi:hypothetical protein
MIKQDWNISEEDRRRILSLHETATKENYLIFEQKSLTPKNERVKVATENYGINFQFPTGFHSSRSVDSEGISIADQVTNAFVQLRDFLDKYDKPKIFNVQISSGESAVPNKDREVNGNPSLPPGKLGLMRSQTIENLLRINFQELVDERVLDSIPEIKIEVPIIGKSTIKDSPEARKEQFIRANFIVKGLEKTIPPPTTEEIPCDLNVQIKIEYIPTYNSNPKFHCCDNANFTLQLNGVDIKVQGGDSSVFSLNNHKDCGARSQILYVDPETAQSVLSIKQPIDIGFRCESTKCHEAPMLMTVFRDGKQIEKGKYLGTAMNRADRMNNGVTKIVGTMDKCGKITFVDDELITKIGEGNN